MMNTFFRQCFFHFLFCAVLSGCYVSDRTHGFMSRELDKVQRGATKKESVIESGGVDPIAFSLDPHVLHYVQQKIRASSLRRPLVEKVYFYTFVFDNKDTVIAIDRSKEMPWDVQEGQQKKDCPKQ